MDGVVEQEFSKPPAIPTTLQANTVVRARIAGYLRQRFAFMSQSCLSLAARMRGTARQFVPKALRRRNPAGRRVNGVGERGRVFYFRGSLPRRLHRDMEAGPVAQISLVRGGFFSTIRLSARSAVMPSVMSIVNGTDVVER